jgi:hypothetical protein
MCGDLMSGKNAEYIELNRYISHYKSQFSNNETYDKNVLWASENHMSYISGNGITVFDGKTQGYPYHLAVLSVGILFESRFPNNIYVAGDFNAKQVNLVTPWMNNILAHKIQTPIILDGKNLYDRLSEIYDHPELVIRRFQTLYLHNDTLTVLLQYANRDDIIKQFMNSLSMYSCLSQRRAISLMSEFLVATNDLPCLINCVINCNTKGQEFKLEDLLNVLVRQFITSNEKPTCPFKYVWSHFNEFPTIDSVLCQSLMSLHATNYSFIDFYINGSDLLSIFTNFDSEKRDLFKKIIEEGEEICKKKIEEASQELNIVLSKLSYGDESVEDTEPITVAYRAITNLAIADENKISNAYFESYIIENANENKIKFADADKEKLTRILSKRLHECIKIDPDIFNNLSKSDYLRGIYNASFNNSIVLGTDIWEQIDNEENINILKMLYILTSINNNELMFYEFRQYTINNPEHWQWLLDPYVHQEGKENVE